MADNRPFEDDRSSRTGERSAARVWASRLLILIGIVCLLLWTAAWAEDRFTEAIEGRRLEAADEPGSGSTSETHRTSE